MAQAPEFHFDTDCDFAALVYGPNDQPDAVLAAFVRDLSEAGYDAAGLIHHRPDAGLPPEVLSLPDGTVIGGRLESPALMIEHCCAWLRRALVRRPDLVAINRFGSFERRGEGLVPVIYEALEQGVPVVLAVPAVLFDDWRAFSEGMAVRLTCERASLDSWWRSLGEGPARAWPGDVCAEVK